MLYFNILQQKLQATNVMISEAILDTNFRM